MKFVTWPTLNHVCSGPFSTAWCFVFSHGGCLPAFLLSAIMDKEIRWIIKEGLILDVFINAFFFSSVSKCLDELLLLYASIVQKLEVFCRRKQGYREPMVAISSLYYDTWCSLRIISTQVLSGWDGNPLGIQDPTEKSVGVAKGFCSLSQLVN